MTIKGLCTVKKAVRFYDPVNSQPENIAITKELKRSISSHYINQAQPKAEKLDERRREEAEQKKERGRKNAER